MAREYIAAFKVSPNDMLQFGRKGMKWGVRRDRSELRTAGKKASTSDKPAAAGSKGNIQDNVESSSSRYDRIAGTAKAGRAQELTEQDLKFFNARTDALAKVSKMNEVQPSWLAETSKKVIQQTAQNQMQAVADGIAKKYIGGPILDAINGGKEATSTPSVAKAIKSTVETAKAAAPAAKTSDSTTTKPPGMTSEQSLDYFRNQQPASRTTSTASQTKSLLDEVDAAVASPVSNRDAFISALKGNPFDMKGTPIAASTNMSMTEAADYYSATGTPRPLGG